MPFSPRDCQYLLWDQDGTLTDSKDGILRCIQYALEQCGCPEADQTKLFPYVGPPLYVSFHDMMGMSQEQTTFAIEKYRERFSTVGMFENAVYEGIPELLENLNQAGYVLAVATSKPEVFARKSLAHFGLAKYFSVIAGSDIRNETETKADVIRKALCRLGLSEHAPTETVMIGDRKHDIIGAHACNIPCIGVRYGYAQGDELEAYGADTIVSTVAELKQILI